jgi:uncharacterized protein YggT (Ycf19 family)
MARLMQTAASNTANATAMAFVIWVNWLLAHLATSWVMPSEVESAVQALLVALLSEYLATRRNRIEAGAAATAQKALAQPDPRTEGVKNA